MVLHLIAIQTNAGTTVKENSPCPAEGTIFGGSHLLQQHTLSCSHHGLFLNYVPQHDSRLCTEKTELAPGICYIPCIFF